MVPNLIRLTKIASVVGGSERHFAPGLLFGLVRGLMMDRAWVGTHVPAS
tara:strand:+ start:310421 stop:310567 length:147 start_codon:yes stop_codon:yes gene_type:complete